MQDFTYANAISWDDAVLVKAIAHGGTLKSTAKLLNLSHATVFRRLRELEGRLRIRLFERSRGGYVLTPAGADIREVAVRLEREFDALQQRLAGRDVQASGTVRVATVDTLIAGPLMPILARFCTRYPEIHLDLMSNVAMADLSKREADVAVRAGGRPPADLVGRKLCRIEVAIYAAKEMPRITKASLAAELWVAPSDRLNHLASYKWLKETGHFKKTAMQVDSLLTLSSAVASGAGLGLLPCYLADTLPGLQRVGEPIPGLASDLWLLTHQELRRVKRIRLVMDWIHEEMRALKPLFEGREPRASGETA
jgi:DNA-binding transcriptional LysR family regulator